MDKVGNMEGVIVNFDKSYRNWVGIDFGKDIGGHDCNTDIIDGHGWYVEDIDLRLVTEIKPPQSSVYEYEYEPYSIPATKRIHGSVVDKFEVHDSGVVFKVIQNGRATIVILDDGSKGVSKCCPLDTYDEDKGLDIAWKRAWIKRLQKEVKVLAK
jgi:hypothetical protein